METYDTYCLIPEGVNLAESLDRLFCFDGVVYHDGDDDHRVHAGQEAATAFSRLMRNGDFIRFDVSRVDHTQGGWLYRLDDGSAVIGLSGDAGVPGSEFRLALKQAIPGCQCCTYGDQPPPMTRSEFMHAVEAQS